MRKLEIQDAEIMKVALQQEIVRSEDSRYDHRLDGVLLVCAGKTCYENVYFETLERLVEVIQSHFAIWFQSNLQLRRLCAII